MACLFVDSFPVWFAVRFIGLLPHVGLVSVNEQVAKRRTGFRIVLYYFFFSFAGL